MRGSPRQRTECGLGVRRVRRVGVGEALGDVGLAATGGPDAGAAHGDEGDREGAGAASRRRGYGSHADGAGMRPDSIMMGAMTVQISDQDRVRTIVMHRPERLNAFDGSLVNDLSDAVEAAAADPDVAVVVLTGSGRAFSTGADLKALSEPRPAVSDAGGFNRLLFGLADFPKPLLMAVN